MPVTYSFVLTIDAPDVTAITLNGQRDALQVGLPAVNANMRVAAVGVQTYSGQPYTTPLVLGGADAGKFVLSHGGVMPCDLLVAATSLTSAVYQVSITAQ